MSKKDELADLLAQILDDSQPLPGEDAPEEAPAAPVVAASKPVSGDFEFGDPESFMDTFLGEGTSEAQRPAAVVAQVTRTADLAVAAVSMGAAAAVTQLCAQPEADNSMDEVSPIQFPEFTQADFADTADLRNFAVLVSLSTSRWNAAVKDKQASKDAATASGAHSEAFTTRKHLLVGADAALKAVHKAIDEARAAHYELTVPWSTTSIDDTGKRMGGRLLPNTLFVEYTTIMAQRKAAMNRALDTFIEVYPEMIETARAKLGTRFLPQEYPPVSNIRGRFDLSFEFAPIPHGDDFKGLAATQLQALAKKLNSSLQLQAEYAMQDLWARMRTAVERMAERLSSPDKTFHNTLVQNARDVARLAGHLNVTGDPKVEQIRKLIEMHLCQHEPKEIRETPTIRSQVAAHARDILERMST